MYLVDSPPQKKNNIKRLSKQALVHNKCIFFHTFQMKENKQMHTIPGILFKYHDGKRHVVSLGKIKIGKSFKIYSYFLLNIFQGFQHIKSIFIITIANDKILCVEIAKEYKTQLNKREIPWIKAVYKTCLVLEQRKLQKIVNRKKI